MEDLTEAQQQKALQNFVYRKNYYKQYQKENRDKCFLSSKKYFDSLMNDAEKKAEYKKTKQVYYQRVGKKDIKNGWKKKKT